MILRSQSVATYGPQRLGHFGLSLASYAHFTSPIRRYADLLVHRALIAGLELGEGGRAAGADELDEIAGALSETERSTQMAEREVLDRIAVSLLADRVGAVMEGRVSGVSRAGLFVTLAGMGADGLLPMSHLPGGRYRFDARNRLLRAGRSGSEFRMGDRLEVRIAQVSPAAGGLILDLVSSNP
jgi:ribonuclease R